ncbi:MAG: hypothetical protein GKR93_00095 [Gammaproteobacteria bacterium]|nr:hypothetical protein [Gammaproteobacteria bacterium]
MKKVDVIHFFHLVRFLLTRTFQMVGLMHRLDQGSANTFIQNIYDAAINPSLWNSFLDNIVGQFKGSVGVMVMLDPDESTHKSINVAAQFPEELYSDYLRDFYLEGDIWYQIAIKRPKGTTFIGSEFIQDRNLAASHFYNDCLKPADSGRFICCAVDTSVKSNFGVSVSRPFKNKDFDAVDRDFMSLLTPHFLRARFLHHHLKEIEQEKFLLQEALHESSPAIILLNNKNNVIFVNRSADNILRQSPEVNYIKGKLRFRNYANQDDFNKYCYEAKNTAESKGHSAGGCIKVLARSGVVAYHIVVTPLNLNTDNVKLYAGAAVGVFILDPKFECNLSIKVLQEMYGLSPAEAKLTQLLYTGKSLAEICKLNSVKITTVKSQLRKVFEKTETKSQSELMFVLARGSGLIRNY